MKTANLIPALLTILLLSACGAKAPAATATPVDVNAVQTAAVQTVVANITQTAAAQPSPALVDTQAASVDTDTPVPAGPTETATVIPSDTPNTKLCDDSAFVSDASVADGTHMAPGQSFVKTWRIQNTGTCTWTTSYQILYGYGTDKMGGLPTALTAQVLPGQEAEISVNLTAPTKTGNWSAYWRLRNGSGVYFGQRFSVIIIVP
jgi:Ig-like domain from next to BRCA1 gene